MKRKILSLILVVAMLASMAIIVPTASAAESKATLAFGNAAGVAGDTVTVDFKVTTDSLQGVQFMFEYDASRLEFVKFASAVDADTYNVLTKELTAGTPAFTTTAPYLVYSWAEVNGAVLKLSEGEVIATLTFAIKEDAPAGDAFVKFVPLSEGVVQPNKLSYGSTSIVADEMTFVDGKVTVLPAGYSAESNAPVVNYLSQDDVDNGVLSYRFNDAYDGVIITGYAVNTYSGIVVLPSVINDTMVDFMFEDYPVVGIDSQAFYDSANNKADTSATAFVIPESVTEIAGAAFFKCSATDYYVLNADCVIAPYALGTTGNIANNKYFINNKPVIEGTTTSTTTIHGGANAQEYAETPVTTTPNKNYPATIFSYSESTALPTENKVTFDGNAYFVATGATIPAPGTAVIGGKTVIAWTDGANTYAPGADIVVDADIVLEPVTISAPQTIVGTDFKVTADAADLAMRFTSTMAIADYNKLAELGTVELGMLITPAAYVAKAGSFTKEALDALGAQNGAYVDIAVNGYYEKTDADYIFAGSLKGFSATTLAKNPDFAAVLYATVTTDAGETFTVYGDFNFAANSDVKTVAETLSTSNKLTDTQKGWLADLVSKFGA